MRALSNMRKTVILSLITAVVFCGTASAEILKNESEIKTSGYYKVYLSSGIYVQGNYRDGKREGRFETYDEKNGKRLEVCHYYAGEKHGICKKYHPQTGELLKVVEFFVGVPHGSYKEYYENGKLKLETYYRHGVKEGVEKAYYDDGRLAKQIVFKNNQPVKVSEYDRSGKVVLEK